MFEKKTDRGTMFSLDVDQREYWITAKHILTGKKRPPHGSIAPQIVDLRVLDPAGPGESWLPLKFSVLDAGKDVDIVVLIPTSNLLQNPSSSPLYGKEVMVGGNCQFLGLPYGAC